MLQATFTRLGVKCHFLISQAEHAFTDGMQAETQLGECMLYNLAEWAREQIPHWLEQSIVERSMPAAAPAAESQAAVKEVWQQDTCNDEHGVM